MRTSWHRLPLTLRIAVIAGISAVGVRPLIEWYYLLAFWFGLTILLSCLGAFRLFRLVNLLYLTIVLSTLIWVFIFLKYHHHPLIEARGFAIKYPQFLMFLLVALIVTSGGILLEEWIALASKIPVVGRALCAILISLSTGVGALTTSWTRTKQSRRNSNPRSWYTPTTYPDEFHFGNELLDRTETLYTTTATMLGVLVPDIRKWWDLRSKTSNSGGSKLMRLDDIYKIDSFPQIYESVFARIPIATEWQSILRQHITGNERLLEIGSGSGRLSFYLASLGVAVDAIESNPFFVQLFQQRLNGNGKHPVRVFQVRFPTGPENQEPYDLVVLHQNVMLELVNEMSLEELWKALKTVTTANGVLIFDYPSSFHIPKCGEKVNLLTSNFPELGQVEYGYTYYGVQDGFHRARISLNRKTPENIWRSHGFTLSGVAPEVDNLLSAAKKFGFKLEETSETQAYTFFPSDLQIYAMRLT